ncbi:MAG: endonuclease VII domain-containing protein [Candidatus Pacebacteria bacterium]|nr:endonuclease VII domain-containing protein [Candidatus Paceibacterota bacterium]
MPYKDYEKKKEHSRIRDATPKRKKEEKARHLLRAYNMTLEQWNQMLKVQNGICANPHCDKVLLGGDAQVDHDHKTKKVRELLCTRCNTDLGRLEDKHRIEGLYLYLKKHEEMVILKG